MQTRVVVSVLLVSLFAFAEGKTVTVKRECAYHYIMETGGVSTEVYGLKNEYKRTNQTIETMSMTVITDTLIRCDHKNDEGLCLTKINVTSIIDSQYYPPQSRCEDTNYLPREVLPGPFEYDTSETVDCPYDSQTGCVDYCTGDYCRTLDSKQHVVGWHDSSSSITYLYLDDAPTLKTFESVFCDGTEMKKVVNVCSGSGSGSDPDPGSTGSASAAKVSAFVLVAFLILAFL